MNSLTVVGAAGGPGLSPPSWGAKASSQLSRLMPCEGLHWPQRAHRGKQRCLNT